MMVSVVVVAVNLENHDKKPFGNTKLSIVSVSTNNAKGE